MTSPTPASEAPDGCAPSTPPAAHAAVSGAPTHIRFVDAAVSPLWDGLTLDIHRGEWLTILGPNGVGKSTLLNVIAGTRRLTAGSCTLTDPATVALIPQQRMFDPTLPMRARDIVALGADHSVRVPGVGSRTFTGRRRLSLGERRERVADALREVGAENLANLRVGELSGGQQQLVRHAQALAAQPDILLCDEPLLSLDVAAQQRTVELLHRYHRAHNTTVVFITHTINPVVDVTDRMLYLGPQGHHTGTIAEVMRSDILSSLFGTEVTVTENNGRLVVI